MAIRIALQVGEPRQGNPAWLVPVLEAILEALIRTNELYIESADVPWLYESGVRYIERQTTILENIPEALAKKRVDCGALAAWRAAELRQSGIDARPLVRWHRDRKGRIVYHALVRTPQGIEDPSRELGMP